MAVFDKVEFELFAVVCLLRSFPQFVVQPVKGESPDWWNEVDGVGIEVSRAEDAHIGYANVFANRYLGKHREEIPEGILKKFNGDAAFDRNNKLWYVSPDKGLVDGKRHICYAIEQSKDKLNKLNSGVFHVFQTNCLFLYMTMCLEDNDPTDFSAGYKELAKQYHVMFKHVFLEDYEALFHFDFEKRTIEKYKYRENELPGLIALTNKLREASTWDNGTSFEEIYSLCAGSS